MRRKLISFVVALAMVLSMTASVFAAEPTTTFVNSWLSINAHKGKTHYEASCYVDVDTKDEGVSAVKLIDKDGKVLDPKATRDGTVYSFSPSWSGKSAPCGKTYKVRALCKDKDGKESYTPYININVPKKIKVKGLKDSVKKGKITVSASTLSLPYDKNKMLILVKGKNTKGKTVIKEYSVKVKKGQKKITVKLKGLNKKKKVKVYGHTFTSDTKKCSSVWTDFAVGDRIF